METQTEYAPFAERPEPYPDGYRPNPARWSGREIMRVEIDCEETDDGVVATTDPRAATADPNVPTARTSTAMRYFPAERLPAARLVIAEHITDDPGALALHGRRIRHGEVTSPTPDDPWTGSGAGLHEVPVGAVLVSVETDADGLKHWRAWRVTPIGMPVLVLRETAMPGRRDHLPRLAALLDEDLRTAFETILERYGKSGARPEHVEQMRLAIERWRFGIEVGRKRLRRRAAPEAGRAATGTRPRLVACG